MPSSARISPALTTLSLTLALSGCVSPITLDRAVRAYDDTTSELLSKQLLVNIARARHHQPIHFTGVSNIAATFNFQFNAGATPALTGSAGGMITPIFGGSVAENPTITIVPVEGEEFTKRMLTPFQESKLTLLLRQGADIDLVLRLLAGEFRRQETGGETAYYNKPSDSQGYPLFRRVVTHVSSIQDRNALYVEPLMFEKRWSLPAEMVTTDGFQKLQQEFSVEYDAAARQYRIAKRVTGRIVITNYDPALLSNEERARMNEAAEHSPDNEIPVDIRPGHPGGEYPFRGQFRLRSFANILNFIGRGIAEEPEYDVPKDPRTPAVAENPIRAIEIVESDGKPDGADLAVSYRDRYYAVRPETGYQWNQEGFRLLSQLFQMTVTDLPRIGVPGITIAK
ncbi:MAG: hypothetical protein FIA97_10450 [Methylococcaceae bacterium]|nr:hypothetical protein [Methylococcaceae bacterium]